MFSQKLAVVLLTLTPLGASAYETGNLTCENIGQLAGQTLMAKQSGIPEEIYLSLLTERLPGNADVERKLVANITTIIYQNDLLASMQPSDAHAVFQQDCVRSRIEDSVKGQADDNGGATDEDGEEGEQDGSTGELRS
jgi:hypothetical protein